MYTLQASFLALTLVGAMSSACSESPYAPTSPASSTGVAPPLTPGQIAGTWSLSSLQRAGQPTQAVPSNATYTLTLDDNRASARADCNQCSGSLAVSGQLMTIGPAMACTRAACPTMAFESAYASILSGESTTLLEVNTLTLDSSRGRLVFTR